MLNFMKIASLSESFVITLINFLTKKEKAGLYSKIIAETGC
jgi:hypothetical protein